MRQAMTFVLERLRTFSGRFETEPMETAWAETALLFINVHRAITDGDCTVVPQLSADGINWVNEGAVWRFPLTEGVKYFRLRDFGGWIRFCVELPEDGEAILTMQLNLKE